MKGPQTVVIDNGTGFTKIGYAGNQEPTYLIPSQIAIKADKATVQVSKDNYDHMEYFIGDDIFKYQKTHNISYILEHGEVKDWELMEKYWHRCFFSYLRADPEEHNVVLTEPPMNPPENRETMAEIMFETFNVKGLYIGVQAVMALYSNWGVAEVGSKQQQIGLTGAVCDIGDGVTHVIPIADGNIIGTCVKSMPIAGRDITKYIIKALKDRGEQISPEDLVRISKDIKDNYSYIAKDPIAEFAKWDTRKPDNKLSKKFKVYKGNETLGIKPTQIDVGYEIFMGPEMLFRPEICDEKWTVSLHDLIDQAIQSSPIDYRRKLYDNIVLSGGTTLLKGLDKRLKKELQNTVNLRLKKYEEAAKAKPTPIEVSISFNPFRRFAVWHGAATFASSHSFEKALHTREKYFEEGPSIARHNPCFVDMQ